MESILNAIFFTGIEEGHIVQALRKGKACDGKACKDKSFKVNACKGMACKGNAS
jgi:hypothetical protein